jgi:hypothetical protein
LKVNHFDNKDEYKLQAIREKQNNKVSFQKHLKPKVTGYSLAAFPLAAFLPLQLIPIFAT